MKGCICLDIDGTITADPYSIPAPVLDCLRLLHARGWVFLFATGRTYTFAQRTLKDIDFPYFFAVQNGSDILQMPQKQPLIKHYLSSTIVSVIEEIGQEEEEDFIIYAGWQRGDFCYYRPKRFSAELLEHIDIIKEYADKPWQAVDSFCFSAADEFPLLKYLGSKEGMHKVYAKLKEIEEIEVSYIKDPISKGVYLNLITAPNANKGYALQKIRSLLPPGTLFIAAGDDRNDLSMLEEADIAIAVGSAPAALISAADILAKPASEMGIIQALLQATKER